MLTWEAFPFPLPRHAAAAGVGGWDPALVEAAFPAGVRPGILGFLGVVFLAVLSVTIRPIITRIALKEILVLALASDDVVEYSFGSASCRELFFLF